MSKNKKRIKRVRHHELVSAAKKRIRAAYIAAGFDPIGQNTVELTATVVKGIGTKYLRAIESDPDRFFNFPLHGDLVRLAKDELMERSFKLNKE